MDERVEMARLTAQLERFGALLAAGAETTAARAPAVSGWSVGAQVDHALRSTVKMLAAVRDIGRGRAAAAGGSPTFTGRLVLTFGRIPRGRAAAPREVVPAPDPDVAASRALLEKARALVAELAPAVHAIRTWPGTVPHPMLGSFSAPRWLRFCAVHNAHHLAIVDEILATRG
jgi:hypothetical protein